MTDYKNYTLGRGRVYFSRFRPDTQIPEGFLYIGNTPEFNLTIESEDLPHYSSDEGIREKDDGVTLEVTRTGTMITDNINPENVALFFFGANGILTSAAVASQTWVLENAIAGRLYSVGSDEANPMGYRGLDPATFDVADGAGTKATGTVTFADVGDPNDTVVIGGQTYTLKTVLAGANDVLIGGTLAATASNLNAAINAGVGAGTVYGNGTVANASVSSTVAAGVVTLTALAAGTAGNAITLTKTGTDITVSGATLSGGASSGGTPFAEGVDYLINFDTGALEILETGAITTGTDLEVTFGVRANTQETVISGTAAVEGALKYIANNPKGKNFDYHMGYVNIRPNGDYALKGDEWQQIPFTIDILKPRSAAAILMNGRPKYQ